jgi:hypothetical protein
VHNLPAAQDLIRPRGVEFGRFAVAYGMSFFRPNLDHICLPHELELSPPLREHGLYSWLRLDDYSTERITKELVRRGYDVALVRRSTPRTYVGPSRNFHLGPKRNIAAPSGRLTSSYPETVGSYICA